MKTIFQSLVILALVSSCASAYASTPVMQSFDEETYSAPPRTSLGIVLGMENTNQPQFEQTRGTVGLVGEYRILDALGLGADYRYTSSYNTTYHWAGARALYHTQPRGLGGFYVGAKAGLVNGSCLLETSNVTFDPNFTSRFYERVSTAFFTGPVIGMDWLISDSVSLGAEGELLFAFFSDETVEGLGLSFTTKYHF